MRGEAERELLRTGLRYALGVRLVVVGISSVATLLLDTARQPGAALAVVVGLNVWNCWYAYRFVTGRRRWLVPADVTVLSAVCLTQLWTTPAGVTARGTTWVLAVTAIAVIAYAWQLEPREQLVATVVLVAAHLAGVALAEPRDWLTSAPVQLWMLAEGLLSRALLVLVRRGARDADYLVARRERARVRAAVAAARRADEREYLAALHDTASATLLMVGSGVVPGPDDRLSEQAGRDLEVLDGAVRAEAQVDLAGRLREVVRQSPLRVSWQGPDAMGVPGVVAAALAHGAREALTNVARHAGVDRAELTLCRGDRTVVVEVRDRGIGFDPAEISVHRYGVTGSLVERMARIGGSAEVSSRPGAGAVVRLTCPVAVPAPPPADARVITANLARTLRLAVAAAALIVLYGLNLPKLVSNQELYSPVWVQVLVMGTFTAVTVVHGLAAWRRRRLGRWRWLLPAAVLTASVAATEAVPPDLRLGIAHWTAADATWTAVLIALELRPAAFAVLVVLQHAITFGQVALGGDAEPALAGVVNATLMVLSYQLAVGALAWGLRRSADAAARTAHEHERARTADAVSEQLHRDRTERYAAVRRTAAPLLAGLASGELDPGDAAVRRACAVEAARMRRLFAEHAAVPDPLAHELRACVELAERRGVAVGFAERGDCPDLPADVRRALTEPIVAALATAIGSARLTLVGSAGKVSVSVVADAPDCPDPGTDRHGVSASVVRDGAHVRIKTTWREAAGA